MTPLWEQMPPEMVLSAILVPGGAFRKWHQFGDEGERFRFFFILNRNPQADNILVVVTATKQIEARKRCRPPEVLVTIDPGEYDELSGESLIDCSSVHSWNRAKFETAVSDSKITPLKCLSQKILDRLRAAVSCSTIVQPDVKRLVLDEEES